MPTLTATNSLSTKLATIEPHIGNTPLLRIEGFHDNENVQIFAKLEWKQLSGSVKLELHTILLKCNFRKQTHS